MTPQQFVNDLNTWTLVRGPFPDHLSSRHEITTRAEAEAICHALIAGDIDARKSTTGTPALFPLAAFFQGVRGNQATGLLRERGLPLLRLQAERLFDQHCSAADRSNRAMETLLFLLKVIAIYREPVDAALIVKAARIPGPHEDYLWSIILGIVGEGHPGAKEVCEGLREPLPGGFLGVAYLDFANGMARERRIDTHPFDTADGHSRLISFLTETDPDRFSYAHSAAAAIPFISAKVRSDLLAGAGKHPDPFVRMQAAWAQAMLGEDGGIEALLLLCLDARFSKRAVAYLRELGLEHLVPAKAVDPDFAAMSEMCDWLTHPNEFGRPPRDISVYDTRVINWPPTGDRRQLWLLRYRIDPTADEDDSSTDGVGLVGSVTFSLFGEARPGMRPEDIYALHCCWELDLQSRSSDYAGIANIARGREILAEANPGFARIS